MADNNAEAVAASMLDDLRRHLQTVAAAADRRSKLTATATARQERVSVTVNADGVVIRTRLSGKIDELSYDEIAEAFTAATQDAAAQVSRMTAELLQPVMAEERRLPKLSELVAGMPDLQEVVPDLGPAPTTAPQAEPGADPASGEKKAGAMAFTDVEDYRDPRTRNKIFGRTS